jgi:hypothetical protein
MSNTIADLEKKLAAARKAVDVAMRAMRRAGALCGKSCRPESERFGVALAEEHAAYDELKAARAASNG